MRIDKCAKCQSYHPKGFDNCPKRHPELASFDNFNDSVAYFKHGESPVNEKLGLDSGPVENQSTAVENDSMRESERKTLQQWRERNRERYNETMRQWREDNREKVRAYQREYMRQRRKQFT